MEDQMQNAPRRIIVVLPAFNEERDLPQLLDRINLAMGEVGMDFNILLVDDGSTDETYRVAQEWSTRMPLGVKRHEANLGLGATLRDGVEWACQEAKSQDIIVTLDADNTHTPELIVRMSRMIREGHDVVIASRFQPGSRVRGVPFSRRVVSRIGSLVFRVLFPIKDVRDYTCGYRAYRADVLQRVTTEDPKFFDQDGFQAMVDVLLKLRRDRDLIFGEAPLILRYDFKEGTSKMDVKKTIFDTLRLIARRLFS